MIETRRLRRNALAILAVTPLLACATSSGGGDPCLAAGAPSELQGEEVLNRFRVVDKERDVLLERIENEPWPFPAKEDPEMAPDNVLALMKEAAKEIGLAVEFGEPSCDEYPCLYWGKVSGDYKKGIWNSISLKAISTGRTSTTSTKTAENCDVTFFVATAYKAKGLEEALRRRMSQRIDALAAPVMCKKPETESRPWVEPENFDKAALLREIPLHVGNSKKNVAAIYGRFDDDYIVKETKPGPSKRKVISYRFEEIGVWFFFDEAGLIRNIRVDPPFVGDFDGVKLGDTKARMLELRGEPTKVFGSIEVGGRRMGVDKSHVYGDSNTTDWVRFDIPEVEGKGDEAIIERIFTH